MVVNASKSKAEAKPLKIEIKIPVQVSTLWFSESVDDTQNPVLDVI